MNIYIAAPYELRDDAIATMKLLESRGNRVTSSWLRHLDEEGDLYARIDLADITRADMLLALNPGGWKQKGAGGRHVELGYALALGKKIVVVGVRSNIFHHLSHVLVLDRVEDLWASE